MLLASCSDDRSPTDGSARAAGTLRVTVDNSEGSAISLAPRSATVMVGHGVLVRAQVVDASGQPVAGAQASWVSTNPAVATAMALPDSGLRSDHGRAAVRAIGAGTALIIASYDKVADTATITVVPRTDSVPTPPQRAKEFDLTARVTALVATGEVVRDSILQRLDPIPGSRVTVTLLPLLPGETVPAGVTAITTPTVAGTATADAQGRVSFTKLTGSRFRIDVEPPAGSGWKAASVEMGPPFGGAVHREVMLQKQ
jgi:hypothetical protein